MDRYLLAAMQLVASIVSKRGENIKDSDRNHVILWIQKEQKRKRPASLCREAGRKEKGRLLWDVVVLPGKRAKRRSELSVIWEKAINTLQTFTEKSKTVILAGEKQIPCPSASLSKKKEQQEKSKVARRFSGDSMHSTHFESENAASLWPSLCSSLAVRAGKRQEMLPAPLGPNENKQEVTQLPDPGGGAKDEKARGAEGGTRRAQVMQQGGGSQGGSSSGATSNVPG